MSHPLLTKVLTDAMSGLVLPTTDELAAAIPPDIANRLEHALNVCAFANAKGRCHEPFGSFVHGFEAGRGVSLDNHPHQPLVQP